MNEDHYAVVIGLSAYPGFTDPPADLEGPGNDADAVHAWLTDPAGGGLPEANVIRIKSAGAPPPPGQPTRDELEQGAFLAIERFALANMAAGRPRRVGRRLYVHMSGHGFSPQVRQGCLLAGNAGPERITANIGASLWLQWWQDAGYFREYVLLMDCCMNRVLTATPTPAPLTPITVGDPPGASFIAFAAQRPLKAVEAPVAEDGGQVHGLFTWALLQGLRGAAVNTASQITGRSLANWLRNAVSPWLSEVDRRDPDVSQEPEIVAEDESLVFARAVTPLLFDVTLRFPAEAIGAPARLWSGTEAPQPRQLVAAAELALRLPAGLHLVEGAGYRQGFEVVRAGSIAVTERGPPVMQPVPGAMLPLTVEPDDPTAEISVVAADFSPRETAGGRLATRLPFGLYKTRIRIGRQVTSRVLALDGATVQSARPPGIEEALAPATLELRLELPQRIASSVPFHNAFATRKDQVDSARHSAERPAGTSDLVRGRGAELMIMARSWSEAGSSPQAKPWQGVRLVDAKGRLLADLETDGRRSEQGDPFATCTVSVAPGTYFLRHALADQRFEQALVVPGGWRLETYLLRRMADGTGDVRPRLSFLMRRPGEGLRAEDELLEKARLALADERPILGAELESLLVRKFANPIEGIVGAHLLLLQHERSERREGLADLDTVVRNLRHLVGDEHPDVEALSLRCPDRGLRRTRPLRTPPMFERSWRLIIAASQDQPGLVPLSLWQRVHALAPVPPFLAWSVDAAVQADYREALADIAFGERPAETGEVSAESFEPILKRPFGVRKGARPQSALESLESFAAEPAPRKPRATAAEARGLRSRAAALQLPPAALRALRRGHDKLRE
ncbi:caspase family protein [Labrys wisconsinensis]|uniref:Caspase domain-containing protein n=1 Tax=Labrys wisconsinensis TaxID=425677 RepID=A0ABU0JGP3_9HYPH|nr:caspase family protein [Labrys wisconsinensis]MDQ0473449.1 hypothetical protein [Labrys wisconsinensis]